LAQNSVYCAGVSLTLRDKAGSPWRAMVIEPAIFPREPQLPLGRLQRTHMRQSRLAQRFQVVAAL
jgi:hypothetical protein